MCNIIPLDEMYSILYNNRKEDYHTFADRRDICNNTLPEKYDLQKDSMIKVQSLIDF